MRKTRTDRNLAAVLDRNVFMQRATGRSEPWDMVIIGGGATGVGAALDAAARGYSVLLLEQSDFGKGTSSRSTKLVHGGVRYLQQGDFSLVMEALKERGILRRNAPHVVHDQAFIVPNYAWWEAPFYGVGLKLYDLMAFRYGFGWSRRFGRKDVLLHLPTLQPEGLRGGILYHDGQFDDTRLLINLVTTAAEQGATLLNYARVTGFTHDGNQRIAGVVFEDVETGVTHTVAARTVVNATGAFTDEVRKLDDPNASPMIAPSQGVHLVLDRSFLPGSTAIMVPKTRDGRVMFAIPWHDHVVLGTTDTPIATATLEPQATDEEIDFILTTAGQYLVKKPVRSDVLSVFSGIRPLVKASGAKHTAALSRDHTIQISPSGLITICGGKWTTYRKMAEDCVDHAAKLAALPPRDCLTRNMQIHGFSTALTRDNLKQYGADAAAIQRLITEKPSLGTRLHDSLPIVVAEVIWAVHMEMARTVEDVLSRRTRALFLNARAAVAMAPTVAKLMAREMNRDAAWQSKQVRTFSELAAAYMLPG